MTYLSICPSPIKPDKETYRLAALILSVACNIPLAAGLIVTINQENAKPDIGFKFKAEQASGYPVLAAEAARDGHFLQEDTLAKSCQDAATSWLASKALTQSIDWPVIAVPNQPALNKEIKRRIALQPGGY